MDMRNQEQRVFRVDLKHDGGYRFVSQASENGRRHGEPIRSDEPDPVGEGSGPATPALLGTAVGHCLSASLLEALRHAHIGVEECQTEVLSVVIPNHQGLPRIDHVDVVIRPLLSSPSPRTRRCQEVFERHCTVTSSVREGIDVRVRVDWQTATSEAVAAQAAVH
jgi:organic hydroperoxide reductase OsmC/OhrA